MAFKRKVHYYKHYFREFYRKQEIPARKKIDWIIGLIRDLEVVPSKFLKHIKGSNGIYEIRIRMSGKIFRIFCFFDEGNRIIILNGFQKKTQKIPKNEIRKAEKLKMYYYANQK